jgi:hypothetical protein
LSRGRRRSGGKWGRREGRGGSGREKAKVDRLKALVKRNKDR